jgi:hypothetical protein
MKNYGDARQSIKEQVQAHLKTKALEEKRVNTPELDKDLSNTSDEIISQFERLVQRRHSDSFMRGVWQGVVSSVLFVLLLAALGYLVGALNVGSAQDAGKLMDQAVSVVRSRIFTQNPSPTTEPGPHAPVTCA